MTALHAHHAYKIGKKVYNIHLDWSKRTDEPKEPEYETCTDKWVSWDCVSWSWWTRSTCYSKEWLHNSWLKTQYAACKARNHAAWVKYAAEYLHFYRGWLKEEITSFDAEKAKELADDLRVKVGDKVQETFTKENMEKLEPMIEPYLPPALKPDSLLRRMASKEFW